MTGYVLYQAATMLPLTIHILMHGTPEHLTIDEVIIAMEKTAGVCNVHHVHVWQIDEHKVALEAHVVITDFAQPEQVKTALKTELKQRFSIVHSTLEFEVVHCCEGG